MPKADATLSEFLTPRHGICTAASHMAMCRGSIPWRSLPCKQMRVSTQPVPAEGADRISGGIAIAIA